MKNAVSPPLRTFHRLLWLVAVSVAAGMMAYGGLGIWRAFADRLSAIRPLW